MNKIWSRSQDCRSELLTVHNSKKWAERFVPVNSRQTSDTLLYIFSTRLYGFDLILRMLSFLRYRNSRLSETETWIKLVLEYSIYLTLFFSSKTVNKPLLIIIFKINSNEVFMKAHVLVYIIIWITGYFI